jgi:hypothetical protein
MRIKFIMIPNILFGIRCTMGTLGGSFCDYLYFIIWDIIVKLISIIGNDKILMMSSK